MLSYQAYFLFFLDSNSDTEKPTQSDGGYPDWETRKKIVNLYQSGKKRKTIEQLRHDYSKLTSLSTVKYWASRIDEGRAYSFSN